jgi:hypothetical protein
LAVGAPTHAAPSSKSQQFELPHGGTRPQLLVVCDPPATLQNADATSQSSTGNVPVIWFSSRYLRREAWPRVGRRGRGGSSHVLQLGELADLGRKRGLDSVVRE